MAQPPHQEALAAARRPQQQERGGGAPRGHGGAAPGSGSARRKPEAEVPRRGGGRTGPERSERAGPAAGGHHGARRRHLRAAPRYRRGSLGGRDGNRVGVRSARPREHRLDRAGSGRGAAARWRPGGAAAAGPRLPSARGCLKREGRCCPVKSGVCPRASGQRHARSALTDAPVAERSRGHSAAHGSLVGSFTADKATSQLLLETDWESILQICDMIRQGDTQAKYAVNAIKKKVNDKNPHVALYALEVMESVVKNCGQTVHDEVANKQTMEELKEILKRQVETSVRSKILYLIQAWAHAFRNEPKYKVVQDTYQIMKVEGHVFPEFKESDAMFAAERAPDWVDAEECHRCRVQFGVVTRKHHCRACGQIFCGKCSSKYSTIPKFGIEKEVRVCEPCYEHLNKKTEGKAAATSELPPEYLTSPLSQQSQLPPKRDETALQEEEELQLAIALSQSEAEEKERMRQKTTYSMYPKAEPTPVTSSAPPVSTLYSPPVNSSAPLAEDIDPELARYLNRNYWEKKQEEVRKSPTPSAPLSLTEPAVQPGETHPAPLGVVEQQYQNGESEENHEQFLKALQNAVTTFVNRMKSNHMRGRSITNDSAVLSLFQSINNMHPQLLELLNQLDERRLYYEGLQDKLAQIRDARGALNALREEHQEKLRRAAEEAERQRQIQLAQKLEIMRQKKQEYLEMQRQLAIQRLQEQEKERQLRLEQQKQTIQMRAQMPAFSLPYAQLQAMPAASGVIYQPSGPTSFPGTFSPAGSVEGSPMHSVYMNQAAQGGAGPYTAMPVTGTDPSMVNAYMYQPGASSGQGPQQGPTVPTTTPAYSSYQPTPTQGYQTAASQSQSIPAISQAPQSGTMGYMGNQSVSMGYQPYSMQGLMSALPGQDTALSSLPAQQSYLPGQQPLYQQVAPAGGPPQQQPPAAPAPGQQPPGSGEAQLISFD